MLACRYLLELPRERIMLQEGYFQFQFIQYLKIEGEGKAKGAGRGREVGREEVMEEGWEGHRTTYF